MLLDNIFPVLNFVLNFLLINIEYIKACCWFHFKFFLVTPGS